LSASRSVVGVAVGCEPLHADKSRIKQNKGRRNFNFLDNIFFS
jgi:hypothetical protein